MLVWIGHIIYQFIIWEKMLNSIAIIIFMYRFKLRYVRLLLIHVRLTIGSTEFGTVDCGHFCSSCVLHKEEGMQSRAV